MSDNAAAANSLAVRRALIRCDGRDGCPCMSTSSHRASPSRTRSTASQDGDADDGSNGSSSDDVGDGSNQSCSDHIASSKEDSATVIPDAVNESSWSDLGRVRVRKCTHGRHAILKKCWGGKNTGRRFLGCPMDEDVQCDFVEWLDDPWPPRVQASLKALWREVKITRRCEAAANESLIDAIRLNSEIDRARKELQEEVKHTKKTKTKLRERASVDKSKLMYLIYYLLGLIVFLVIAVSFKGN